MKSKFKFYYIGIFALTLILISYLAIDHYSKANNNTKILSTLSLINNSYKDLSEGTNYDTDNVIAVSQENLDTLNSLKNKDYTELINNYKSYFTSIISLKDNKNSVANYIMVLNSALENLEDIKSYYSNKSIYSNIKNFQAFYKYNNTFLLKELEASKKSLNADINNSIATDYSHAMNKFYATLTTICQDLTPALQRCYENKSSLDNILNDIYIKQADIKVLKEDVTKVSIPSQYYSSYEGLQELIKLCDIYLESMREVLVSESSSPSYDKDLKEVYANPFSKHEDLTIKMTEYLETNTSIAH